MASDQHYTFLSLATLEPGTWADWFSGTVSAIAVVVALSGYWLATAHRRQDDKRKDQGAVYQIAYKLSALASEAKTVRAELNPQNLNQTDLMNLNHLQTCATLPPMIGTNETLTRDLTDAEQNLLISLKEENFVMNFSECFTRNATIRVSMQEYQVRHEAMSTLLPTPTEANGDLISFDLSAEQFQNLQPKVIAAGSLIRSIRELAKTNDEMMAKLCAEFHPTMTRHFPKLHIHRIEFPDKQEIEDGQ